ncbi:MAG: MFS transporter [Gammaproteobacteria bacterium]|jgi:predicted MFS family arabinose efflux permease
METDSSNYTNEQNMRRLLTVLAACSFFVGLDSLITVPLLPAIVASSSLAKESGVFLVTAYALAYMLTAPIFGALSDYWGRKRLLVAGVLVLAAGTALTGLGDGLVSLMVYRSITGIGAGMIQPAVFAMIGDSVTFEKRGRAMGIVTGAMVASTLFGVPAGAFLAQTGSWQTTFWIVAGLALLLLIPLRWLPKEEMKQSDGWRLALRSTGGLFHTAISSRVVGYALIATFLWYGGLQGLFANIGLFYDQSYDLNTAEIGQVIMLAGLGSFIGSVWGGRLADRFGKKVAITCAGVITVIAVANLPFLTRQLELTIGVHVIWAMAFSVGQTALTALISELRPEVRGTVMSLNSAAMFAGMMVLTGLSSPLLQAGGFAFVGYLCAVASLLAVMIARFRLTDNPLRERVLCMDQQNG